ncbi:MAG: LPS export ABC transporter periplasmic protein LptC [Bacteroidales bacterium]|nr:LPS export ABC transporter periplasmic protein LptC [Bacteroidales bacterium]
MRKHSFAMIILAFAFSYFCFSCSKDTPKQQYVKNNNTPTQVINDAYLLRSVDGVVDTELKAKKIEIYNFADSSKMIFTQGLNVNFLNNDKTIKANLSSHYAESLSDNLYYLKDSVVIINHKDLDTFYCQDLYWRKDSAIVRTDLPVRRHSEGGIDYAKGLRARDDFDSVKVISPYGVQNIKED